MTSYAKGTDVSSERSRAEIERTLVRFGADSFVSGWERGQATIMFEMRHLRVMFRLPMPDRNDERFTYTNHATPRKRSADAAAEAWEQATKEKWRELALIIKAKLVAVQSGVVTFEQEFGMHVVLPDGRTVGDYLGSKLPEIASTGQLPALLPGPAQ